MLLGQIGSPGSMVGELSVGEDNLRVALTLERDVLECCFLLEEFVLNDPLRRDQHIIRIAKAVAEIEDAAHLYVGKSERLYLIACAVPLDHHLVKGLSFERHHGAIGMNRPTADLGNSKISTVVGKFDIRIFAARLRQNFYLHLDGM